MRANVKLDNAHLDFAIDLAQRAGDILLAIRERGLNPETIRAKLGHFDIVTEADLASERFVLSELRAAYPAYGIISEETNKGFSDAEWVWIVDPLDGTTNYSHGLPIYGVNIALARNGYPLLGVTYEPANNRTYWAVRGRGAWARSAPAEPNGNGETQLHVSEVNELKRAILATGFQYSRMDAGRVRHSEFAILDNLTQSVRRLGAASMTMAWVASGHLEAYWETGLKPWDFAPGWVMIEEAGGHLIDYNGKPAELTTTSLIMSNGQPAIDRTIMQTVAGVADGSRLRPAASASGRRRPQERNYVHRPPVQGAQAAVAVAVHLPARAHPDPRRLPARDAHPVLREPVQPACADRDPDPLRGELPRRGRRRVQGRPAGKSGRELRDDAGAGAGEPPDALPAGVAVDPAGHPEKAVPLAQRAVDVEPSAENLSILAMAQDWSGEYDDAIKNALKAVDADPESAQAHATLAEVYADRNNWQRALEEARQAEKLDPNSGYVIRNLGYVLSMQGRSDEALEAFARAAELAPKLGYIYISAGNIYMVLNDYDKAIEQFEKAVAVNPDIPTGYDALGHASALNGDPDRAKSMLRKAIELDPDYAPAHAHLGRLYYTQLNWESAIESFNKAFELGLKNEEYFYELGLAYSYLDDCPSGIKWFEKALELNPDSKPAQDGIRRCKK